MSRIHLTRRFLRFAAPALLLAVLLFATSPSSGQGFKGFGKTKLPDFIPADYDDYQKRTEREIPLVILSPRSK